MYNHEPQNYVCPFCLVVNGVENGHVQTRQSDIIYKDDLVTSFIASCWWGRCKGHVIIIPNNHYENIYDLPDIYSHRIHDHEKEIALALRSVYKCDGISSRQHNEPGGDQDVWHYHLHVFPRYVNDNLYIGKREFADPMERISYANRLKEYLSDSLALRPTP